VLLLGAVLAPLAAAVTAVWPSRATRWAARACLTMVALAVVLLAALWVEDYQANRGYYDADSGEYVDQGDDSGVVLAMSAVVIAIGLANLAGWAVANARTRTHRDRLPPLPPPTAASGR
jgi:type VI protein secretion system component VasK